MSSIEQDVQRYLHDHVAPIAWELHPPARGWSGARCFIARSSQRTVFVKLGGDERVLQLLSDAKLTPELLAGGAFAQTRITVQAFVEGQHPTRQWYASHMNTWADLIHRLSQLSTLRALVPAVPDETYQSLLTRYVGQVQALYTPANLSPSEQAVVETLLEAYAARIPSIAGAGLVPTHGDPGPDNLLIAPTGVYLIDWDRLHRSDPMRDVALVAWWMYPPAQWPELLDRFGIDLADNAQQERFSMYISVWSLEVALFFANAQHHQWKTWFLRDAQRALAHQHPDQRLFS